METTRERQIGCQYVIYLRNVHTSDIWTQQKKHYFQQKQEQHNLNDLSSSGNGDEEFAFHLLDIHARFCIKPSCRTAVDGDITSQLNSKEIPGCDSMNKWQTVCNDSQNYQNLDSNKLDTDLMSVAGLVSAARSDYSFPAVSDFTFRDAQYHSDVGLQASGSMMTAATSNIVMDSGKPCWIVGVMRTSDTTTESVPAVSCETQEGASGGWISKARSPYQSQDHETDSLTPEIKIETVDGDGSDLGVTYQPQVVNMESPDASHGQGTDIITRDIKIETDDATCDGEVTLLQGEKTGLLQMKEAQVKLKKLKMIRCHLCHKVLQGNRFQAYLNTQKNYPTKCGVCMKEGSCTNVQTGHEMSPGVVIPRRECPAADKMNASCESLSQDTSKEYQEYGGGHQSNENDQLQSSASESSLDRTSRSCEQEGTDASEVPYKCNLCYKSCSTKMDLEIHMRAHANEGKLCGKALTCQAGLQKHMMKPTNERLLQCSICLRAFISKHDLTVHMRMHSEERPYECNLCSKAFTRKRGLILHMRTHTGEKPFKCNLCSKAFSQKHVLQTHVYTHTGERPFECNLCSKAFKRKGDLDEHIRTHTGEKPFKCNLCSKAFLQKCLKAHIMQTRSHEGKTL